MSAGRAGLVLGIYGTTALVASPLFGKLSDQWGPLRVMTASLFVSGTVLFLFPLAHGWTAISVATVALAASAEAFRPSVLTVISQQASAGQRRSAFALVRLAINLGMSIGPAIGGFLAVWKFDALFWVDGATSLAAGFVLVAVKPHRGESKVEIPVSTPEKGDATVLPDRSPGSTLPGYRDRRLLVFLGAVLLTTIVFFQHEGAMPLFLVRDLHFKESTYGLLFTINTMMIVFMEVPLNLAMSKVSHQKTLAWGSILCGAGFGALAVATGFWGVAGTVVIWTFGEMVLFPSMSSYVADISPDDRRGEYMGLYTMAFALAFAIGPWAGTVVYERLGATTLWIGSFVLSLAAASVFLRRSVRPGAATGR